jgi:hypothetical protein
MTPLPAQPARDVVLRHGYTLAQVSQLSVLAVRRQLWYQAADFDERLEVAWAAIIEHLYTCDQPPLPSEVIRAGWQAIGTHVDKEHRFHGLDTHDRYAGITGGFERYWWYAARPAGSPEERVAERVALAQIWPRLRPVHREVLAALAAHDDYGTAAESLGKSRKTFTQQVSTARREFLALWHEGEAPSRPWGTDRRVTSASDRHTVTYRAVRDRQRRARRRAARTAQAPPAPKAPRPRAALGISDAELVRRYEAGESVRQLAASLGKSYSVVHRRLHTEGAHLRSVGQPSVHGHVGD